MRRGPWGECGEIVQEISRKKKRMIMILDFG